MTLFLKHPRTGVPDVMLTLSVLAVVAASIKFFLDGVDFSVLGHHFVAGHSDPMSYGSFLTPVLASHAYTNTRPNTNTTIAVDNPDA